MVNQINHLFFYKWHQIVKMGNFYLHLVLLDAALSMLMSLMTTWLVGGHLQYEGRSNSSSPLHDHWMAISML
nr:hypothetical protein Iba_chr06cCG15910 [Ipomoea batatas]GMD10837.1 hypothetical protein Iba_chr06eCG10080 [Ipomoea batatas]GME14542.1 hypothetical protein Iba_scaffold15261CG0510 [Ipomoea batatas]